MKTSPPPHPPGSRWRTPLFVCGALFLLTLIAGASIWWWLTRPITPTILTTSEQAVLQQKIETAQQMSSEHDYVPGGKTIILTERELNGLLGLHDLGDQFRLDLAKDAIHARLNTKVPADTPFLGGKTLKAKARFFIKEEAGSPSVVLDDLSIWGISLPNAWLGNLKGDNLVELITDQLGHNIIAEGIDSFQIDRNQIVINLAE